MVKFNVVLSGDETILENECTNEESETQTNCSLIFKEKSDFVDLGS